MAAGGGFGYINIASKNKQWYDRNPLVVMGIYSQAIAPAAKTQRVSYTVPANRKAQIELLSSQIVRWTAAGAVVFYDTSWSYTPAGSSENQILQIFDSSNVLYTNKQLYVPLLMPMLEGDILKGYSEDGSTGGTVFFTISFKATEYDKG